MNEADEVLLRSDASLTELVNRVLDRGALITGEVVIGVAGVDLIFLGLQIAVSSVESMEQRASARRAIPGAPPGGGSGPEPPAAAADRPTAGSDAGRTDG